MSAPERHPAGESGPSSSGQWLASIQPGGEELVADVCCEGLRVLLFGAPKKGKRKGLESELQSLVAGAVHAAAVDLGPNPLPGSVHHALAGLLDWFDRVRGTSSRPLGALILFEDARDLAFGCVAESAPNVRVDGVPVSISWIQIEGSKGRRARGFAIQARPSLSVELEWCASADDSRGTWAHASWKGAPPAAVDEAATAVAADAGVPEDSLEAQLADGVKRGFMDFMDRMEAQYRGKRQPEPAAEAAPAPVADPPEEPANEFIAPASVDAAEANAGYAPEPVDEDLPEWAVEAAAADATPATGSILEFPGSGRYAREAEEQGAEYPEDATLEAGQEAGPSSEYEADDAASEFETTATSPPRLAVIEGGARSAPVDPVPAEAEASLAAAPATQDAADDPSDGVLSAPGTPVARRAPRRLSWEDQPLDRDGPPDWKRWWPAAVAVVLLFAVGWVLGTRPMRAGSDSSNPSIVARALRAVGMGGAWFACEVTSHPEGAWISVDGKDLAKRTPAHIELEPGEHVVRLSLPEFGHADYKVSGRKGAQTKIDAKLGGSLTVEAPKRGTMVEVWVDGVPRGVAPITISDLAPGAHDVRFSAPGSTPWGQTVRLNVHEDQKIVARPFDSPAAGRLTVRATASGSDGIESLKGATVWIDGRRVGATPLTLQLSSGPHSVRVEHRGEEAAVQVIDLPGGNERFATFALGSGLEPPRLSLLDVPASMPVDKPTVVSAALSGVGRGELREMWLHVRAPDGPWRRYPMALTDASGAVVGTVVFPTPMLDRQGRAPFYVSASTTMGDDYYSEIQNAR